MKALRALVLGALTVASLATCGSPRPSAPPPPDLATVPPPIATTVSGLDGGPVPPPATGAMLGAWVKPPVFTQPDRIAAVELLEQRLGRPLDIVHTYRPFDETFFTSSDRAFMKRGSVLMLSWAGADTRAVAMGRHDDFIRERARRVAKMGKPLLLRYRWEMDRPNLRASMWSGPDYVTAWRHVRQIFREEGATNVAWVWCPTAEGFTGGYAQDFYPGDDAVDWVCADVYAGSELQPIGKLLESFLRWASSRPKPIIIGEFGIARGYSSSVRAAWLRNAAAVFEANPQIKAVAYFESNPDDAGPMRQFRLSDDPPALAALASLAQAPHFHQPRR